MQHQFILRVLFLLFLAVVTAIALEDGGDSRREMTTDWSGTTETSVTTDGHQLIVSRSEEEMAEDGRSGRAAEIQATNLNLGNPSESPSTTTTTTTTTPVPISSSTATDEPDFSLDGHETSTSGPTLTESSTESLSFTSPSTTDAITTSTETVIVNSSTTTLKEEEEEEEEIRHIATTPTPAKETSTASIMNGDEYVADDHGPSLTTDNEGLLDSSAEASVVNHKHTEPSTATQVVQRTTTVGEETATATISTTTTEATTTPAATIKPSLNHLMTAAAAVGRSLAQEENVAWPESKSTKVIGTIIEDIHSPSSSSSTAESITNGSIVAIALCTVCLIVSSLGASGYWWYRRRYLTNRPETLSDRYAPSETGASGGEDIFRVGYINSPEMPRDSSEEMYSLDNDSFLTSLEAMTIPTYWTESIKHTKL